MLTVSQLLEQKRTWTEGDFGAHRIERVHTISQACTALDAAHMMNEHRIGSLIVTDGLDNMVGIITERDLLRKVLVEQRDPAETTVINIMTSKVVSCDTETRITELREIMMKKQIRHVPVLRDQSIVGMISIGDINAATNEDMHIEVKTMREYIAHG